MTENELRDYIQKNREATELILVNKDITELPPEIGRVRQTEKLDLSNNHLRALPSEIGLLKNLQTLNLAGNHIKTLPHDIGNLANLRSLYLGGNQLKDLPPNIGRLTKLKKLSLWGNKLKELPPEIGHMANLQTLNLANNQLAALPLKIGKLVNLLELDLWNNKLTTLPAEICKLKNLSYLRLENNPLETPPPEILIKGIKAIQEYLRQLLEEGTDRIYEAKLLIVGEPGAGKTSLAKKILNPDYKLRRAEGSTRGIDVFTWHFPAANGPNFRVNLWDFGGQEIYHATHQFFLTKRSLYALVADSRKEDTDFYYWLNVVELLSDNSPLFIVLNEKQNISRQIGEPQLRGQFANLKEVLRTNLKTNRGLKNIQAEIQHHLVQLPHVGTTLPRTWIKVREALEKDPRNYMELQEYLDLCERHGFGQRQDALQLSGYLHDLGVCLHFQDDPLLKRTVILKPQWGTTAVYKILVNRKVIKNLGRFNRGDLVKIWSAPAYADRQDELLHLMMRFKLCYEIPGSPGSYIAPQLLTENQPDYAWENTGNLFLRYTYDFMPKGILTRFIVEMHRWIAEQKLVWRSGIVLEKDQTRAEVIEHYGARKITIRVAGRHPRDLRTSIMDRLDEIHASYPRLGGKYKKLVPCNCSQCQEVQEPEFYPFEKLRDFQKPEILCWRSGDLVKVKGLLDEVIEGRDKHREERIKVFVSYSHKDTKWLERLQTHLKPLVRSGAIDLWDDTRIKTGADWRDEIETALASAKLAILLISADFLASDFIADHELPPLLVAAEQGGCRILPVIVSHCLFAETPELSRFQAVNSTSRPLTAMPEHEQEELFVKVARTFLD